MRLQRRRWLWGAGICVVALWGSGAQAAEPAQKAELTPKAEPAQNAEPVLKAEPPQGWLFRADGAIEQGFQSWNVATSHGDDWTAQSVGLGAKLDLNLGYAPSRLLRLGLALGADAVSAYAVQAGIPSTEVTGWMRWSVGPRVGFRFGPSLELEVGVAYAQMKQLGGMLFNEVTTDPGGYRIDDVLHGALTSLLMRWSPKGPGAPWSVFAGLNGGIGYVQLHLADDSTTKVTGLTSSFLLGATLGK